MHIELYCPSCSHRFAAAPDAPALEILDRMFQEGPWFCLGDGETFEDMIFHALTEYGDILCPGCGGFVSVTEESLGQLARELLSHL